MKLIAAIAQKFRNQRKQKFLETFAIDSGSHLKILDLGGTPWSSFCSDLQHCQVTYLNLYSPENVQLAQANHQYICADARSIPFPDAYFDIVFSNSLIEHVGNFADQAQVAREIQRVGKSYWVQTPYKHFPIEPHYNFPGFQYLPESVKHWVHHVWPFSWVKKYGSAYEDIFLLDRIQMQTLFPEAEFYNEKVGFLVKSITAIQRSR